MSRFSSPRIIKKYGNRRLYDTEDSHYLTQDELAEKIGDGVEVRVVDAKSGRDLTQATLAQIVFEGREAHQVLPSAVLHQFVRMADHELAEFMGRHLPAALERYLHGEQPARAAPVAYAPRAVPYDEAPETLITAGFQTAAAARAQGRVDPDTAVSDIQEMRRELDELKTMIRDVATGRAAKPAPKRAKKKRSASGR